MRAHTCDNWGWRKQRRTCFNVSILKFELLTELGPFCVLILIALKFTSVLCAHSLD